MKEFTHRIYFREWLQVEALRAQADNSRRFIASDEISELCTISESEKFAILSDGSKKRLSGKQIIRLERLNVLEEV